MVKCDPRIWILAEPGEVMRRPVSPGEGMRLMIAKKNKHKGPPRSGLGLAKVPH